MFSTEELVNCPRCAAAVLSSKTISTPWSSHRAQRETPVTPQIAGVESDYRSLLRTIAYALRHDPRKFFLDIDPSGWVDLEHFALALRYERREWANLTVDDLHRMAKEPGPMRFEIVGNRIRAVYGHSIANIDQTTPEEPPTYLFHGTAAGCVTEILELGLLPMGRRFVHLSLDWRYANSVAQAKSACPIVLVVRAFEAHLAGVSFRRAGDHVWLADATPPQFIRQPLCEVAASEELLVLNPLAQT